MIKVQCPHCSHAFDAPDAYLHRVVKCPKCQDRCLVTPAVVPPPPTTSAAATPVPAPSTAATRTAPSQATYGQGVTLIALLVAILAVASFNSARSMTAATQRWEYGVAAPNDLSLQTALDEYGRNGWELVTARRAVGEDRVASYEMIFKRPK